METFLRRAYGLRTPGEQIWENQLPYPFWDYRCRRGSSSPETHTSGSSSEGTSIMTGDADDLTSYITTSDGGGEPPPQRPYKDMNDVTTSTSTTSEPESVSVCVSELGPILENDTLLLGDAEKMVLQFLPKDQEDGKFIRDLYKPLFDCVGVKQDVYFISHGIQSACVPGEDEVDNNVDNLSMPSLAVVVFLREEEEMKGENMWARTLDKTSWKFHHSEHVSRGKLQAYENNSQDYLSARPDLPLCAMRQIHCGKKMLRFLRFVSSDNWRENVRLYGLLLGKDPEVFKQDFCLFTSSSYRDYCIQLSLKKIPQTFQCRQTTSGILSFRVCQLGHIVPLLPNVCTPITDDRWQTTDLDGNVIYLDVVRMRDRSCEPVPDLSDLEICDYFSDYKDCPVFSPTSELPLQQKRPTEVKDLSKSHNRKTVKNLSSQGQMYKSGTGTHGHYDSMEELGLLIKDLAGKMEGSKNKLALSDREACGVVDGASHHSEGNAEDRMCLPFDPDVINPLTKIIDDESQFPSDEFSFSSTSSSNKAELTALNTTSEHRSDHVEKVYLSQRKPPQKFVHPQYYQTPSKDEYFEPHWPSNSQDYPVSSITNKTKAKRRSHKRGSKTRSEETINVEQDTEAMNYERRPPLPSYNEIQHRKQEMVSLSKYSVYTSRQADETNNSYQSNGCPYVSNNTSKEGNLYRSKSVDELDPKPLDQPVVDKRRFDPCNRSDEIQHQRRKPASKEWQGLKVHQHPTTPYNRERLRTNLSPNIATQVTDNSELPKTTRHYNEAPASNAKNDTTTTAINDYNHELSGSGMRKEPPPYRPRPMLPPPVTFSEENTLGRHTPVPHEKSLNRFEFNGTTVPRFGRNNKYRQSVVPPPSFNDSGFKSRITPEFTENTGLGSMREHSDYEELAVDVPGASGRKPNPPRLTSSEAPTLGFYV